MKNGMTTDSDGTRRWYLNDLLHRADGPAAEYPSGTREWCLNDKLHREDGPAIERADGLCEWYHHGKLHRTDGPAVEYANGTHAWWLNDKEYTFTEWLQANTTLDDNTRLIYMLRYSDEVATCKTG